MKIEVNSINLSSAVVMTILNVTPDSFFSHSRKELTADIDAAVQRAVEDGAGIIDVGGYSSRPGAKEVSVADETERVSRGVEAIRRIAPQMPISIDTFRSEVARHIIDHYGECIVNDISAGELDDKMIDTVAKYGVPYIAMHMRANPATMQQHTKYSDIVAEIKEYFVSKIAELRTKGVDNIIIDPGFGFAKQTDQNFTLLAGLNELTTLDAPMLVGVSRKSMIYKTLDCTPEDALTGTTALHWEALRQGANILRVHDTKEAVQVVKLFEIYKKQSLKWKENR